MPHNLHVVKSTDFVRLDAHGNLDLEESRRALAALAKISVEKGINYALLDVRDLHADLSLADLYRLVLAFQEMGFKQNHRLAVLHRYTGGKNAEFFALCAQDRGWNVRAFDDFEAAVKWLNGPQTS